MNNPPAIISIESPPSFQNVRDIEIATKALNGEHYLPYFGYVRLKGETDFELAAPNPTNTHQLWFHSLPSTHALLWAYKNTRENIYAQAAFDLLEKYLSWLQQQPEHHPAWSDEHAVTNRLRLLNYCSSGIAHEKFSLPSSLSEAIAAAAEAHAEWLYNDAHYMWNNHGLMMDRALLEAAVSLADTAPQKRERWTQHSVLRSRKLLLKTFDSKGCCTENSPSYFHLNLMLFRDFSSFCRNIGMEDVFGAETERLRKAENIAGLFVRTDGTLATVGDTELHSTHWIDRAGLSKIVGTAAFPESGFFIHKTNDTYLTAKCGGSSFNHRHIDETSITLQRSGIDFIIDAGLYNFLQNTEKLSRWFRPFRAHSGIFTEDCDGVLFAKFDGPTSLGSMSEINHSSELGTFVNMTSNLSRQAHIERRIAIAEGGKIVLYDQIASVGDMPVDWRLQFLVPAECTICDVPGGYTIASGGHRLTLLQKHATGVISKSHRSRNFGECEEAQLIRFAGSDIRKELVTELYFE